jgi:tol-pal system protein YbgF
MTKRFGSGRVLATACAGVLSALVATGAQAADREHAQLMADLRMLQEQTQQLQVTVNALTEALKLVTKSLDDQSAMVRKSLADQKLVVDTLTGDVRVVREKLDETNVRISSLSQEFEALRTNLTTPPPAPVAPPLDDTQLGTPTDPTLPVPASPAPSTAGLSPQRLYDQAFADYTSGQWALAIRGFETFISTFPRSEQADDAQFYIGETYTLDGKPDLAVAAFDKEIANYPTGDTVPMAYYKRGLLLSKLGQNDQARESFQAVIQKFPDSDASRLAKQGLDRLTRPK